MAMQPPDFGDWYRPSQETLRESEERFRLLVEGVKDYAIFMLDADVYIATWNSGVQRIKGYEAKISVANSNEPWVKVCLTFVPSTEGRRMRILKP